MSGKNSPEATPRRLKEVPKKEKKLLNPGNNSTKAKDQARKILTDKIKSMPAGPSNKKAFAKNLEKALDRLEYSLTVDDGYDRTNPNLRNRFENVLGPNPIFNLYDISTGYEFYEEPPIIVFHLKRLYSVKIDGVKKTDPRVFGSGDTIAYFDLENGQIIPLGQRKKEAPRSKMSNVNDAELKRSGGPKERNDFDELFEAAQQENLSNLMNCRTPEDAYGTLQAIAPDLSYSDEALIQDLSEPLSEIANIITSEKTGEYDDALKIEAGNITDLLEEKFGDRTNILKSEHYDEIVKIAILAGIE